MPVHLGMLALLWFRRGIVEKLMKQILDDHPAILKTPASSVLFDDFADSSLTFSAIFWVCAESEAPLRQVRSELRFSIYKVFAEITLPLHSLSVIFISMVK